MKRLLSLTLSAMFILMTFASCNTGDILNSHYQYDLADYITLPEYKGLDAKADAAVVTDEEVELMILSTRSYHAKKRVIDAPAARGHYVTVHYDGTVNGESFGGSSAENLEFMLGAESTFKEIESALIGLKAGDSVTVSLTLPAEYDEDPAVAGMIARFEVHLHEVKEQVLPEYSEDFVRAYLGYKSIAEFEESIRADMLEKKTKAQRNAILSQTWNAILENTEVKSYPEKEYNEYYGEMVDVNKAYAEASGVNFGVYVQINYQKTEEEFYQYADEMVKDLIKEEMVVYAIARAEGIELTDDEYTRRATEYATELYDYESLKDFEEDYDINVIRQAILADIVRDFVVDNANVTISE